MIVGSGAREGPVGRRQILTLGGSGLAAARRILRGNACQTTFLPAVKSYNRKQFWIVGEAMPITNADKRELEQTYSDYSDKYTGRKEDYFACLYLKKKFKTTVEDIARQCAFGNNDYGVDAYYIDRDSRNLYLYQFKWSVNQNLFRESLERLAKEGMERIFGNALQDPEQNELLRNLKADLYEYRSLIQRVFVHYVFKGDSEAAEKSDGLQYRKENVLNKRYLLQQYFNNPDIDLQVEFFSDARVPPAQSSLETYALAFSAPVSVQTADGQKKM